MCTPRSCNKNCLCKGTIPSTCGTGQLITPLLFHVRRKTLHVPDETSALNGLHLRELVFRALRSVSAHMALAAFCAYQLARACQAKTLGSRLMGLELEFTGFGFTRHFNLTPFRQNKRRAPDFLPPTKHRGDLLFRFGLDLGRCLSFFFLLHGGFPRRQHHQHRSAFHHRRLLDRADICQ